MKGLALIIGPKSKKGSPSAPSKPYEADEESEDNEPLEDEDSTSSGYGDILARVAGISAEDKDDFVSALRGYIKSVIRDANKTSL